MKSSVAAELGSRAFYCETVPVTTLRRGVVLTTRHVASDCADQGLPLFTLSDSRSSSQGCTSRHIPSCQLRP